MLDDSLRTLLGRIARGVPVAVIGLGAPVVLSGCFGIGGGCGGDGDLPRTIVVANEAGDAGTSADAGPYACYRICDTAAERPAVSETTSCEFVADGVSCTYGTACVGGRRPQEACEVTGVAAAGSGRRAWLLRLAAAELASVPAFEQLAAELARHGAPADLVARARASADDERRHARIAFGLARRDAPVHELRVEVGPPRDRSLRALALHNAVEGCVREAYAALEAAWQAEHADDSETRAAFAAIARDEAEHARLSLDVDRWARARLGERAALDAARRDGARALRDELVRRDPVEGLGLPDRDTAGALLAMVA